MHWALSVALIGSFLVAVSGQCAHLETKIQQDLALISKLQDQLTDLQWKLAENVFKDDLIATLNSKIEYLSKGNPTCPSADSETENVENVKTEDSCNDASKAFENKIKKCEAKVRKLEKDILKQKATTTTTTKPPKTRKTTINPRLDLEPEEDNETDEEENREDLTDEDSSEPKKTTKPPKKKKPTKKPSRDISETNETTEEDEDIEEEAPKKSRHTSCASYGYSSKIRTIKIPGVKEFSALCDGNTFGPGWTVIQNRLNGDVEFYRSWKEYKHGFGSLKTEFFLGLEHIYRMTNYERYELYIQLDSTNGGYIYARYDDFQIGSEASRYVLRKVGAMTGTAGDRLTNHVGRMFYTYDQGDIMENENYAVKYHGGWWYAKTTIAVSNLNGRYYQSNADAWDGMHWETNYSHKIVKMMIRPYRV